MKAPFLIVTEFICVILPEFLTYTTFFICRMEFKTGAQTVSQQLYFTLEAIKKGLIEDKKGWIVEIGQ